MKTRDHSDIVTTFTYDKLNQLLTEERGSGASYFKDTYTYDANGNRTAKEERRGAGPTITNRSYTYDNSDKMTNYDGTTISYDNFGRPTQWVVDRPSPNGRGLVNLCFDYEGRLKTMAIPGGSVYQTNTYNGLNTRVKVVETGYGSGTRKYVRDGIGVTSPVLRMTTGAENAPTWTNYTPGISERTSGTTKYSHSGIKNVDAQTNASQALTATREYDAFGNVIPAESTGTFTGRFGYGGAFGYQEDDGGLKLLGHRFYDPVCGRFLTRDRIKSGNNWFAYCENNPLSLADPTGLISIKTPAGVVSAIQSFQTIYGTSLAAAGAILGKAGTHLHHLLPRASQFHQYYERAFGPGWRGYMNDITLRLPPHIHRLLHSGPFGRGGWWNGNWAKFFKDNPNANAQQIFNFLRGLLKEIGLSPDEIREVIRQGVVR